MVVYDLLCSAGHHFEGWFDNLEDLESQLEGGSLSCPVCGDAKVARKPSTFGVIRSGKNMPAGSVAPPMPENQEMLALITKKLAEVSARVEQEYDDVGSRFSEEALKMHYGVIDKRNIRGVSTENQEDLMRKEGVEFFKIPMLSRKSSQSTDNN